MRRVQVCQEGSKKALCNSLQFFLQLTYYMPFASFFSLQVVPPINKMIETIPFNMLAYSLDWHPKDHLSFVDNVGKRKLHESSTVRQDAGMWQTPCKYQKMLATFLFNRHLLQCIRKRTSAILLRKFLAIEHVVRLLHPLPPQEVKLWAILASCYY